MRKTSVENIRHTCTEPFVHHRYALNSFIYTKYTHNSQALTTFEVASPITMKATQYLCKKLLFSSMKNVEYYLTFL